MEGCFLRVRNLDIFEITSLLEQQDLPDVSAHDEFAVSKPRVAHEVGRDSGGLAFVLTVEGAVVDLELVHVSEVIVLVDIFTSHQNDVLI